MGLRECQRCMDGQGNWILNGVFIQGSHKKLERKGILQHDGVHKRTGDKDLYGENYELDKRVLSLKSNRSFGDLQW